MTTTYYIRTNYCKYCKRYTERAFGISAAGRRFKFYTDETHRNAAAWFIEMLRGGLVYDEYDRQMNINNFIKVILSKRENKSAIESNNERYRDFYWTDGEYDYCEGE
jgi:hypothetical protein